MKIIATRACNQDCGTAWSMKQSLHRLRKQSKDEPGELARALKNSMGISFSWTAFPDFNLLIALRSSALVKGASLTSRGAGSGRCGSEMSWTGQLGSWGGWVWGVGVWGSWELGDGGVGMAQNSLRTHEEHNKNSLELTGAY